MSDNTVKAKNRFIRRIELLVYLVIWSIALMDYWVFKGSTDVMGYVIIVFYLVIPITTFVLSILIGADVSWGKYRIAIVPIMGCMHTAIEYATVSTSNMLHVSWSRINAPDLTLFVAGTLISLAGFGLGLLVKRMLKTSKMMKKE